MGMGLEGFDISQLSDEQLSQLLALSTKDEEKAGLDEQLRQAQELGKPHGGQALTSTAAAFDGVGNILNGIGSQVQQRKLRAKQEQLLKDKLAGRQTFAGGLLGRGGYSAPPLVNADTGMDPSELAMPFGFGGG